MSPIIMIGWLPFHLDDEIVTIWWENTGFFCLVLYCCWQSNPYCTGTSWIDSIYIYGVPYWSWFSCQCQYISVTQSSKISIMSDLGIGTIIYSIIRFPWKPWKPTFNFRFGIHIIAGGMFYGRIPKSDFLRQCSFFIFFLDRWLE